MSQALASASFSVSLSAEGLLEEKPVCALGRACHPFWQGRGDFPSTSCPHLHTFVCVQVHLNSGVPTRVQDLTGMDPFNSHGEPVKRRGQIQF